MMSACIDRMITRADDSLRAATLRQGVASTSGCRSAPRAAGAIGALSVREKRHVAGLMRVNHTGELCAQALYLGQALLARADGVQAILTESAREEQDHLRWCAGRLKELQASPSQLDGLWYGLSFMLGAAVAAMGDSVSLGFVAATEEQVCQHLKEHLAELPAADAASKAILETMLAEEEEHGSKALGAGGTAFAAPIKAAMGLAAKAMTRSSYYF